MYVYNYVRTYVSYYIDTLLSYTIDIISVCSAHLHFIYIIPRYDVKHTVIVCYDLCIVSMHKLFYMILHTAFLLYTITLLVCS